MTTCFTDAEFEAQFGTLHDRIFRRSKWGTVFHEGPFPAGFVNPDWQVVLLRSGISSAGYIPEIGEKYDPNFPDEYEIFLDVLAEKGVEEVVVASSRAEIDPGVLAFACRPDIDTVRECFDACNVRVEWLSMFDRSGSWGLFSVYDNYGVLGGAPEIMEPYIEKAGGLATIKRRFSEWAESYPEGEWLGSELRRLYDLAGWHDVTVERVT